jgi:hypothetical protein
VLPICLALAAGGPKIERADGVRLCQMRVAGRAQRKTAGRCTELHDGEIEFIDENGGGPGVRLRKSTKQRR